MFINIFNIASVTLEIYINDKQRLIIKKWNSRR